MRKISTSRESTKEDRSSSGKVSEDGEEQEELNEAVAESSFVFELGADESRAWWKGLTEGEYGEGGPFFFTEQESEGSPSLWGQPEDKFESTESDISITSSKSIEETEDEKAARIERERLMDLVRQALLDRVAIKRKNFFLHKKLVEHFKKRRMDNVLKEDPPGSEFESKYLKRLFVFDEFKQKQESEIRNLNENLADLKNETDQLEQELNDTLNAFVQRQKELSLGLVSAKTGKRLSEKVVDRLLRRQIQKFEEKGKLKLKYVKLKNVIEEKENQLKEMENFGEGLHLMDYEQLKIDNQNYTDKIEEKEEELTKLRIKTRGNILHLAQVREKISAVEEDVQLMELKFFEIDEEFNSTRETVNVAKKNRDSLREEYAHLKILSGLLTKNRLLKDFEDSIEEKYRAEDILNEMKSLIKEKRKKQTELAKLAKKNPETQRKALK